MKVVVIGNGISGITAARWVRKLSDHEITVISSESDHFYSRTALMYIYMGHMRYKDTKPYEDWFWEKNRISLLNDHVNQINYSKQSLSLSSGKSIDYDHLILALGSASNKFGWPGQDLKGVSGLYNLQDLEMMETYSPDLKRAVIVGGGLIGIEMAEMFHSRLIPVTMLVREASYWNHILPPEESAMISRQIKKHNIDLRLGVNLQEIIDDGTGAASGVIIKETREKIDCGYVGLTAGVHPNVKWLKDTELEIGRGILVNDHLETNMPNVWAIGDCAELRSPRPGRRGVEAIWYTGRMMGETCAHNICNQEVSYDPGIWFNSAKFLDIEYQVYGDMRAELPEDQSTLYWEDETGEKSIRLNYNSDSGSIAGFNLMGIRYRHEVCEKWLAQKTHIEEVIKNLKLADFDPEFYKSYSHDVAQVYEKQTGKSIEQIQSSKLDRVLTFLKS